MSTKATPKSCSCFACKRGKSTKAGKTAIKLHERAFRHDQKITLTKHQGDYVPAPSGNFFD